MKKTVMQIMRRMTLLALVLCGGLSVCMHAGAEEGSVKNILLIGSDHRDSSWNGNSDVMIVATINEEEQRIILTSFMRDLYADIPGYGVHKLNYAYAAGGASVLMDTLEDNYELEIDNYASVDFDSMADIVDAVGGVEITVSDAEAEYVNGYQTSTGTGECDYMPGGGTYTLTGRQAVAYMRIRFVGNNDYERTERQRRVLAKIFEKTENLDGEAFAKLSAKLLLDVDHDFDPLELLDLIGKLPELAGYSLEENRIPYDDLYYSQNEMLVPDFPATIARLHETLGDR